MSSNGKHTLDEIVNFSLLRDLFENLVVFAFNHVLAICHFYGLYES
jgi:uncharacterized protein YydD (DUF2326 family)